MGILANKRPSTTVGLLTTKTRLAIRGDTIFHHRHTLTVWTPYPFDNHRPPSFRMRCRSQVAAPLRATMADFPAIINKSETLPLLLSQDAGYAKYRSLQQWLRTPNRSPA